MMEPKTRVIDPKEEHTVAVHLQPGVDISPAGLSNIIVDVYYENNFLKPGKVELGSALPSSDYNLEDYQITEDMGNGQGKITAKIVSKGNANFNVSGEVLRITFKAYLPTTTDAIADLTDTIRTDDNPCADIITTGGCTIEVNPVCVGNLLRVTKLFGTNSINLIKPNPVGIDGANIEFTVANEGWTEIKVFNANGQLVVTPISTILKAGEYNFRLETRDLPSGSYTIQMTTGDYLQTRNLNVVK